MTHLKPTQIFLAAGALALAATLTGCAGFKAETAAAAPTTVKGAAIHGTVFGGQQPVIGATIKLYTTGSTGYGSSAVYSPGDNLLGNFTVTSGAGGNFNVTGDYSCPTPASPIYILAIGGNSGFTTNNNIALMAALGPCSSIGASTSVTINEVTTVASVFALAPYMTGTSTAYKTIGATNTGVPGLISAMADVNVLANVATGVPAAALTAPYTSTVVAGATMPVPAIDTLANILAACINSSGGTAGQPNSCGTLFNATTVGGVAPTDTITAAFNIATHPSQNVGSLFSLQSATPPFIPDLASAPADFTLAATFATGISSPSALAADASGNIWITNAGSNNVVELTHTGALSRTVPTATGVFSTPSALAIGTDSTIWVTNRGNSTVSRINSTGTNYTGAPYSGGGLATPTSISLDANGTAWVSNHDFITSITTNGVVTSYSPGGSIRGIAIAVTPH